MTETDKAARLVRGWVKWFDPDKGFGFVVSEEGGPDILLHANVLRNFGQSSVADGAAIQILCQSTPRGMQAAQVIELLPPPPTPFPVLEDLASAPMEELLGRPLEPARVKWFDKAKGFGFANVFGRSEDVFVHIEVLRHSGLSDLQAGEAICLGVVDGKRGRMAMRIAAWEAAVRQHAEPI